MTSTSGVSGQDQAPVTGRTASPRARPAGAARWSTPNRCCSSMTTTKPSDGNVDACPGSGACVPMSDVDLAGRAQPQRGCTFALVHLLDVDSVSSSSAARDQADATEQRCPRDPCRGTVTGEQQVRVASAVLLTARHLGQGHERALMASLHGDGSRALTATIDLAHADVALQQARCIGWGPGQVGIDLALMARIWASVKGKPRRSWKRRTRSPPAPPPTSWRMPGVVRSSSRLRWTSRSCTRSSSSGTRLAVAARAPWPRPASC